ncbi:S-layer homology domain-containing protein [Paenibacillus glacialis]|uniref:SLH domain-containing protein n=1 Tax=Paenibacillus glacialis TaxID=494026 RepID=A0A168M561_9BACL|nr:S-layer homology domain-containing protein [Paenibacillus glacialis]OAB44234.1 hypothetical protein PGLA_06095 [Paenibacillus glacialis]
MKMKKIMLAFTLVMALAFNATAANAQSTKFTDVTDAKHAWAVESINYMTGQGIIKGYSDGTFKPDQGVTKAEFVSMYARLFDKYMPNKSGSDWDIKKFEDVPSSNFAYKYINNVVSTGLWGTYTQSYKNKVTTYKFFPNTKLTRIGAVKLLPTIYEEARDDEAYRIIKENIDDIRIIEAEQGYADDDRYDHTVDQTNALYPLFADNGFFDGDNSAILGPQIAGLHNSGVLTAYQGKFHPKQILTRAEAATTLYRLFNQLKDKGTLPEYSSRHVNTAEQNAELATKKENLKNMKSERIVLNSKWSKVDVKKRFIAEDPQYREIQGKIKILERLKREFPDHDIAEELMRYKKELAAMEEEVDKEILLITTELEEINSKISELSYIK